MPVFRKDLRQRKRMSRKSGCRFSEKDMRQRKRMFRKSGCRFSEKDMRQCKSFQRMPIHRNGMRSKTIEMTLVLGLK